ncbi:carbohydrate ABC transporter substrate-binding protein [Paenibacillus methanolicus]|uniref:N-acetylglucosamine transport system substrate-binding protein n=1 Tax=Paenibacillus methanolicus TaxID=582686 RepID=A0A5S5CKN5_9BACL|nr:carbohydrate ABC transporter substrate-binding protein [Paenibacillus methanolicus]TYP78948.1 N-acetylglucosamine transport system substrate-binding protein [Paenibacillus methanolicus]
MKRNKGVKLVLALAVLASLLAGCGGNNGNNGNKGESETPAEQTGANSSNGDEAGSKSFANPQLEVAVFQGGYGREYWDAVAESFMQDHPGTKINITASPKIGDLVRPKIVAGNPPDFMYIAGGDNTPVLNGLIKDNALLDLTDVFTEAGEDGAALKDKILPGILESPAIAPHGDGKIYLAPYNFGVMGLWYNKALFDAKSLASPKTWDEFFAMNGAAKENGRALFTYQGMYPGYLEEIIVPAIYNVGGQEALDQFFNYDPEFWKSDTFKQAFGILERIASEENALMKGTVALNHTQSQTEFLQGKAMFIPNGSWFEDEMKDAPREDGFQYGFLGVPSLDPAKPVTALTSVEQMVIPAKAKNPELAKAFLKYLYTEKSITLNGEKAKGVLAVKGAPDLVKAYLGDTTYNVYKAVDSGMGTVNGTFKIVAKGSKYIPADEVYKPLSSIINKQMTLDEYAEKLYKIYADIQEELKASAE